MWKIGWSQTTAVRRAVCQWRASGLNGRRRASNPRPRIKSGREGARARPLAPCGTQISPVQSTRLLQGPRCVGKAGRAGGKEGERRLVMGCHPPPVPAATSAHFKLVSRRPLSCQTENVGFETSVPSVPRSGRWCRPSPSSPHPDCRRYCLLVGPVWMGGGGSLRCASRMQ